MLWKIVRYRDLPDWAKQAEYSEGKWYIYVKYPWIHLRASTRPLTIRNLIGTIREVRAYRKRIK